MSEVALAEAKALIFDIDGTLVDSNELHVDSWDRSFRHFGKHFPRESLRAQIGKGSDQYLPEFLSRDEIAKFGKALDEYRSHLFREEYLPAVKPFPRVPELFQCLTAAGKRTLLATSGKQSETEYYVKLLQIGDLIEGWTSSDDADESKPSPDIFEQALGKLKLRGNECLVIGDTRFDIVAAARAGLITIALLCGGTSEEILRDAGAIAIRRDPADLLSAMPEL